MDKNPTGVKKIKSPSGWLFSVFPSISALTYLQLGLMYLVSAEFGPSSHWSDRTTHDEDEALIQVTLFFSALGGNNRGIHKHTQVSSEPHSDL